MLSPCSFSPVFPLQYDQYKNPMENIGLQDSLLSRFDLLFIMLDQMDPEQDREISDHVLRMHRYRAPGEQDGDGEAGGWTNEGRPDTGLAQPGPARGGGRGSIWDVEGTPASLVPTVCLLSILGSESTSEHLLWTKWPPCLWGPRVCFLLGPSFVSLACLQKKRFFSGFSSFLLSLLLTWASQLCLLAVLWISWPQTIPTSALMTSRTPRSTRSMTTFCTG